MSKMNDCHRLQEVKIDTETNIEDNSQESSDEKKHDMKEDNKKEKKGQANRLSWTQTIATSTERKRRNTTTIEMKTNLWTTMSLSLRFLFNETLPLDSMCFIIMRLMNFLNQLQNIVKHKIHGA